MNPEIFWGATGLILIIADVLFGTFFVIFLGIAALTVALLVWMGLLNNSLYQWVCFASFSALGVLLLRSRLQKWFGPAMEEKYNEHIGNSVVVIEAISGSNQGKVRYRGTEWMASCATGVHFAEGETAIIDRLDGIVIYIKKSNT